MVEGALVYTGSFGGFDITASGVGAICDNNGDGESDDCYTYGGGLSTGLFGFNIAGGYFSEKFGDAEKDFFNAGVGAGLGPVNMSVTYGQVIERRQHWRERRLAVELNEPQQPRGLG